MSTDEAPETEVDEAEASGESDQMSERTAKLIIGFVALAALAAIVIVFPYVAYFVAGIMACRGWQKTRGWIGRRGSEPESETDEVTAEDLVETLHEVANPNVFLADLAAAFGLSGADARALLEAHQIRIRRAVRNGNDTGVGVHRDDLPPLPHTSPEAPETPVDLHNQRPTTEPIGLAGVVVKDGSETTRHHQVRN
ncbi:hypothetical protein ACFXC8_00370 [Streptomyces sp. NPDC059441]|uniref:hypothetical protein n=1 Tax=Streptomyces sp. NPDC059441 TaxID=3346829 RepID=UPI0036858F4C